VKRIRPFLLFALGVLLASCSSTPPYQYQYVPGKTGAFQSGQITVPSNAPEQVRLAVAAANSLQGKPYVYGGGHRRLEDVGYDCSGTVSYVLCHAGLLSAPIASDEFRGYGQSGKGKWITIYAARGHVFMVIAGVRLDTGYTRCDKNGPHWCLSSRPAKGCVMRHPPGL
jgi:hypothetical protein